MTESSVGNNTSNANGSMSADAPKTISPAARKFAEYLARRMRPMIEHAAAHAHDEELPSAAAKRHDVNKPTKH